MRFTYPALATLAILAMSPGIHAEIYESKDAQGNTVFTDVPTGDSQQVDLQETNTADSVDIPPPEKKQAEAAEPPAAAREAGEAYAVPVGGNDDLEDLYERKRQQEIRERVGDSPRTPDRPAEARPTPKHAPARAHPGGRR